MNSSLDFRTCPDSGLKFHRPAEALMKANAVAAVVFLLVGGVMGLLPGIGKMKKQLAGANIDEKQLAHQEAIISSMTKKERKDIKLLNASRRKRIAAGSGTTVQEVNRLLKQYQDMSRVMKQMGKSGMLKGMMGGMMGGGGGTPPQLPPGGLGGLGGGGGFPGLPKLPGGKLPPGFGRR